MHFSWENISRLTYPNVVEVSDHFLKFYRDFHIDILIKTGLERTN